MKQIQLSPESQAGCEQSNSKFARYKNKHSNKMGIPMCRARQWGGENGPPMNLFPAKKVFLHWKKNGHRLAMKLDPTAKNESKVIKKIRKKSAQKYTSKLFI